MQTWLYDISERMTALTDTLETFDGDDTTANDIKAALEQVYGDEVVPAVSDGIEYICQQADQVEAIAEKIKRLQALKKSRESRLERVKAGYVEFLTALNKKKIETPNGNMTIAKTPGAVIIDSVDRLPPAYTTTTVNIVPNKVAIKSALQRGIEIEGARIESRETLRIK
jgi:hypothetical protein